MAETSYEDVRPDVLDRTIDLTRVGWATIAWIGVAVVAAAVRLAQLDGLALSRTEARRAFQAFSFFRGSISGPNLDLPHTEPTFLLLQSLAFFLFGVTDVTARIMPALLGLGIALLPWGLRPIIGRVRALGMSALAAISPTLVYASRTADPQVAVAFFTLLLVVAFLRLGGPLMSDDARRRWALLAGIACAAAYGAGPSSLSVLIAIVVGLLLGLAVDNHDDSPLRRSLRALSETPWALLTAGIGFLVTLLTLFTRLFSDLRALSGIGETIADWGRLLTTTASTTPTQFFLLAVLLYEILALIFAIVAANLGDSDGTGELPWPVFLGWFGAALVIFSFSSGRAPEHTIHVALPLVLLGGGALGELFAALDLRETVRARSGTLFLVYLGLVIAVISFGVLADRIDTAADRRGAILQTAAVGILVVFPLVFAAFSLIRAERIADAGRQAGLLALVAAVVFLGAFTVRSSILLNFYNADTGAELLAQRTSTPAVGQLVKRLRNLSRDTTDTKGSPRDPTGGHGLSIAIDKRVQWPYRWYVRDFPDADVVAAGQGPQSGSQVVIAPDAAGMAEAGYTPQSWATLNRVPGAYTAPRFGAILRAIFDPSHWLKSARFLLYRELDAKATPETVAVGLTGDLANRISPNTGPFGLFDRPGAGSGRGQFNQPRGIAVGPDGALTYVVDMGNVRVERFDASGAFVGIWGGEAGGGISFARTPAGLGPTGIAVGVDGLLVYVADTWNHRVVVLDKTGHMVREFGSFKDTQNTPDPMVDPGLFFGPRAIAVTKDEIYVVDTGNERVQVFGIDGTFRRAWGGYGSGPGQLLEPVGIVLGKDGRVYVADSGNGRISVFAISGTPLAQWPVAAWKGQQYFEPYLALDQAGNLYATSSATGSVEVLNPDGVLVRSIKQVGADKLQEPVGITTAPEGTILITDKARNAVFRYSPLPPTTSGSQQEIIDLGPGATPEASPQASPVASPRASPAASPASGRAAANG